MLVHQAKSNKNYPCSCHHMTQEGPGLLYHPDGVWCALYYYPRWIIPLQYMWVTVQIMTLVAHPRRPRAVDLLKRTSTEDKLVTKLTITMWLFAPMHLLYLLGPALSFAFKILQKSISRSDVLNVASHGAAPQHNHKPAGDGLSPGGADILCDVWLKENTNIQLLPRYLLRNDTSAGEIFTFNKCGS